MEAKDDEAPVEKSAPVAKPVAASRSTSKAKPARTGESASARRAPARQSDDDEASVAATDPIAASKGRAGRFVAGAVAILAVIVGVTWYADSGSKNSGKLEKVDQKAAPLKDGDQVTVFDPDHEKKKDDDAKAAAKTASPPLEPKAAEPEPPSPPPAVPSTAPSAAAKPEPPAPPPAKPEPPPAPPKPKPEAPPPPKPPAPPKPAAPPTPPAPPKPPPPKPPSGDPYE